MILSQEQWMNLCAFKAQADAGATWAEIARETSYDWRTALKRYLSADAPSTPDLRVFQPLVTARACRDSLTAIGRVYPACTGAAGW
jgi:hypothetical protein